MVNGKHPSYPVLRRRRPHHGTRNSLLDAYNVAPTPEALNDADVTVSSGKK